MIEIKALASGSKGNCYRITDGKTPLLLECGIPFRDIQRGLNFRVSEIAGCLVSHEHQDHCKSIKDVMKAGIDVYASKGTIESLDITNHRLKPVTAKQSFQIGTWTILPFDTQHDTAEPYGFLLANQEGEKLVFLTDTYYCRYKFNGLTHVMLEVNYCLEVLNRNIQEGTTPPVMKKRLMRSHFSLENAVGFLKANDLSKVQEIWALHLSDSNSDEELIKKTLQEVTGRQIIIP